MRIYLPRSGRPCMRLQTIPRPFQGFPALTTSRSSPATPPESISLGDPTYEWQEDVEDLEGYHQGGYHPVHIQDEYSNGRYRIVHKLGFGTYSTVWLAKDQHMNRYVAVKIVVAEASKTSSEGQILRLLSDAKISHPGRSYVSSISDEFSINGPNGRHLCLVSEPARCSVAASKEASTNWMFPIEVARTVAAQVILGLHYIHSRGVVHGGGQPSWNLRNLMLTHRRDLHVRNILFRLPHIDSLSVPQIYQRFGQPRKTQIVRTDGADLGPEVPSYSVMPAQLVIPSEKIIDPRLIISDFGEAWLRDTETRPELQTPLLYIPPETVFSKASIGTPADVWTLGCTLYEILGERPLFEGLMPDKDDVIAEMVSCLGPPPQQWWEAWQARGEFFLENGSWKTDMKRYRDPKSRPLLLRIQQMGRENDASFSQEESIMLERMLRAMLEYDLSKRADIEDIGRSDWFTRLGLPTLKKKM